MRHIKWYAINKVLMRTLNNCTPSNRAFKQTQTHLVPSGIRPLHIHLYNIHKSAHSSACSYFRKLLAQTEHTLRKGIISNRGMKTLCTSRNPYVHTHTHLHKLQQQLRDEYMGEVRCANDATLTGSCKRELARPIRGTSASRVQFWRKSVFAGNSARFFHCFGKACWR